MGNCFWWCGDELSQPEFRFLHFLVTTQILRLVQHAELSGSVQKAYDIQMQEVQEPGDDSSSQGNIFYLICLYFT